MNSSCSQFSLVTQRYVCTFQRILQKMKEGMTAACLTDSISHNFIVQMVPHHRAAIEMSKNLLCYTTCIPLQEIALGIIDEQTKSIEDMERILCPCGKMPNAAGELCLYQNSFHKIADAMFSEMKNARTVNDINVSFMREMIPHHRGAILMSQNALEFPVCPELTPLLESIVASQRQGVRRMEALLKELTGNA